MNAHTQPPATPATATVLPRLTEIQSHFIAYQVPDDRDAPIVRKGEFVVVDPNNTAAMDASLVLVEWSSGRRSLVLVRAEPCEWTDRCARLRRDGPHLAWWTSPVVRPRSAAEAEAWRQAGRIGRTSEGPLRAEQLQAMTVGCVIGIADEDTTIEWAQAQCAAHSADVDGRALRAAELFDAARFIELSDQAGQVYVVHDTPHGSGLLALEGSRGYHEAGRVYAENAAIFTAWQDGLDHSKRKLAAALRMAGRVVTLADGEYRADPAMPNYVRALHLPARE
jgi:hypothetical protein